MIQGKSCCDPKPAILASMVQDPLLAEISNKCCDAHGPSEMLDTMIRYALGIEDSTICLTSSFDSSLRYLREHFPAPGWKYGFQDAGYKGYTGPTMWMNNDRTQLVGFANYYDYSYRYHARSARTLELASAAVIVLAESYRQG